MNNIVTKATSRIAAIHNISLLFVARKQTGQITLQRPNYNLHSANKTDISVICYHRHLARETPSPSKLELQIGRFVIYSPSTSPCAPLTPAPRPGSTKVHSAVFEQLNLVKTSSHWFIQDFAEHYFFMITLANLFSTRRAIVEVIRGSVVFCVWNGLVENQAVVGYDALWSPSQFYVRKMCFRLSYKIQGAISEFPSSNFHRSDWKLVWY